MLEAYKKRLRRRDQGLPAPAPGDRRRGGGGRLLQRHASSSRPVNINFEHKKLFPGNIGPSTGEMGTSMFWSEPNRLFNQTLAKMEPLLAEEGYVGYIDLNCIVNANGIYPLEFTSRFGYPTIFIQQEGMITPIGQFFFDLAGGDDRKLQGQERLPGRRAHRGAALPVRRRRDLRVVLEERGDRVQEGRARGGAHRGREAGQRPVAGGGHLGRGADRGRPRPDDEAGAGAGLRAHQQHPDPEHVLPRPTSATAGSRTPTSCTPGATSGRAEGRGVAIQRTWIVVSSRRPRSSETATVCGPARAASRARARRTRSRPRGRRPPRRAGPRRAVDRAQRQRLELGAQRRIAQVDRLPAAGSRCAAPRGRSVPGAARDALRGRRRVVEQALRRAQAR